MTSETNSSHSRRFQVRIRYGPEPTTLEEMQSAWKARQVRYAQAAESCRQDAIRASLPPPLPPIAPRTEVPLPVWTEPPPQAPLFPVPPSVEAIQVMVCAHFQIGRLDMLSDRRSTDMVLPRHLAIYLCRTLTFRSLNEIARLFRRDHTTVMHAVDHIQRQRTCDEMLDASVMMLTEKLTP